MIGSTEDARRNGTRHAVPSSTKTATATALGSLEPPSTQLFISRVVPRLSDSPTTTPDTTPILAPLSTFLSTSLLFAPSAIRIPNLLVRWPRRRKPRPTNQWTITPTPGQRRSQRESKPAKPGTTRVGRGSTSRYCRFYRKSAETRRRSQSAGARYGSVSVDQYGLGSVSQLPMGEQ